MQLRKQLNNLFLSGDTVRITLEALIPDFTDSAIPTEADDKLVGTGAQAEELIIERILQHVPQLAPEILLPNFDVSAQADFLINNAVP